MDDEEQFDTNILLIMTFQIVTTLWFFFMYYMDEIPNDHVLNLRAICLTGLLVAVLSGELIIILFIRDTVKRTSMLDRCKRDYKIGLGGISFFAIISHVRLIAANHELAVQINSACVCVLSSTILFIFFVYPSSKHSYIRNTDNFCYFNYALHFVFIVVTWSYRVFFGQFCMIVVTIQIYTLFYSSLRNRVYLLNPRVIPQNNQNNQNVQVVTAPVESSEAEDSDEDGDGISDFKTLECNICLKRFKGSSKRRTPRTLTSCGHSFCHKCLETLSGTKGFVVCPYCTKKTVVPVGGVKMLPKNYTALGLLDEINVGAVKNSQ